MALQTSGAISFANLQSEFGGSNPITMGEYAAFRVSGSGNTISMNQFYGASASLDTQTVTVGTVAGNQYVGPQWGFNSITGYGSVSDGTCNFYSGAAYHYLYYFDLNASNGYFTFGVSGNRANSGWTTCTANGTVYQRTAATYTYNSSNNNTYWQWNDGGAGPNPMGTTVGATKTVVFA